MIHISRPSLNTPIEEAINEAVRDMERKYQSWEQERRSGESGMNLADVRFMAAQVRKMARLRIKLWKQLMEARQQISVIYSGIENYTRRW